MQRISNHRDNTFVFYSREVSYNQNINLKEVDKEGSLIITFRCKEAIYESKWNENADDDNNAGNNETV